MEHSESGVEKVDVSSVDILSRAWKFYKVNFKKLWPLFLLEGIGESSFNFGNSRGSSMDSSAWTNAFTGADIGLYVLIALGVIAILLILFLSKISLYKAISDVHKGEFVGIKDSYNKANKLFFPFILVSIIAAASTVGALLLLIVPGIILGGYLSFSYIELIENNKRGFAALTSSWSIVKGRWWKVQIRHFVANFLVGLYFILPILLVFFVTFVAAIIFKFSSVVGLTLMVIFGIPALILIFLVVQPLTVIILFELYYSFRDSVIEAPSFALSKQRRKKLIGCIVLDVVGIILLIVSAVLFLKYLPKLIHSSAPIHTSASSAVVSTTKSSSQMVDGKYVSDDGKYSIELPIGWNLDSATTTSESNHVVTFVSSDHSAITITTLDASEMKRSVPDLSNDDIQKGIIQQAVVNVQRSFDSMGLEGFQASNLRTIKMSGQNVFSRRGSGSFGPPDYVNYDFQVATLFAGNKYYLVAGVWPESVYGWDAKPIQKTFASFTIL